MIRPRPRAGTSSKESPGLTLVFPGSASAVQKSESKERQAGGTFEIRWLNAGPQRRSSHRHPTLLLFSSREWFRCIRRHGPLPSRIAKTPPYIRGSRSSAKKLCASWEKDIRLNDSKHLSHSNCSRGLNSG